MATTIALNNSALVANDIGIVTFSFDVAVTALPPAAITSPSGAVGAPVATADPKVWTATFTPTAATHVDTNQISLNLASVTGASGPLSSTDSIVKSDNYKVDTTGTDTKAPTATVTLSETDISTGETPTATVTFNEKVSGLGPNALTSDYGTLGGVASTDGVTWTTTFTPNASTDQDNSTIRVNLAGVKDNAGNNAVVTASGAGAQSAAFKIHTSTPGISTATLDGDKLVLTYIGPKPLQSGTETPATAFSVLVDQAPNPVTKVVVGDNSNVTLWLTNPVAPGKTAAVAYTPPTGGDADKGIKDTDGKFAVSATAKQATNGTGETDAPTFDNAKVNGDKLVLTYTDASRLHLTDAIPNGAFTVLAGTTTANTVANAVTKVVVVDDGTAKTVTLTLTTPVTHGQGVTVSYAAPTGADATKAIQDAFGNHAANLDAKTVSNDTAEAPTPTPPTPTPAPAPADATTPTPATPTPADATATPPAATTPPTTITVAAPANHIVNSVATVTIKFDAAVTDFTKEDIDISHANGSLGDLHNGTGDLKDKVWTIDFTPAANTEAQGGNIALDLANVKVAGNAGSGHVKSDDFTVDNKAPVLASATVTGDKLVITYTEGVALSAQQTLPADTFAVSSAGANIAVTSANIDSAAKTVTLALARPVVNGEEVHLAYSQASSFIQDTAGNKADQITDKLVTNATPDTTPPTASVVIADSAFIAGETALVTITFSEKVTGFTSSAIHAGSGTVGDFQMAADGLSGTTTFTPTANDNADDNVIRVDLTGVKDLALNPGVGHADSANYTVHTTPPAPTTPLTAVVLGNRNVVNAVTPVTIKFDAAVTDFTKDDIDVRHASGTLGDLHDGSGDQAGKTWTIDFTPTANTEARDNSITVDLTGVKVAGTAGTGQASSGVFVVDTKAPVFDRATVDGDTLMLNYTEGVALDASHTAPGTAFAVKVGDDLATATTTAVTAVNVDPAGKIVMLTLASAVAPGQTVHLGYTAPTGANAANVIQDSAGNDAANLTDKVVSNLTQEPTPPSMPDGGAQPPSDQVPGLPGPGGAAPVAGDGNGDGIKDSTQVSVESIKVELSPAKSEAPADTPTTFITLVGGGQDGKPDLDSPHITSLSQKDSPAELPQGMQTPIGLLQLTVALNPDSQSQGSNLSLYVDPALDVNGSWVQDKDSGVWVNLASEPYGGKMVQEGDRLRLDFHVADGGQFDADGAADGVITVPGVVAHMPLTLIGLTPDVGHDGFWF